jgi:hypothetical protein
MDDQAYKEVYFDKYCKTCKHKKLEETEAPCDECLGEPLNWNTHRPVKYEEKETTR